jgi:hypothetical protein
LTRGTASIGALKPHFRKDESNFIFSSAVPHALARRLHGSQATNAATHETEMPWTADAKEDAP